MKPLKELAARLKGETPTHFKRVIRLGFTLGAIGAVILGAPAAAAAAGVAIVLPAVVTKIAGYFVTAGIVAAGVSKTAVKDPENLEKK